MPTCPPVCHTAPSSAPQERDSPVFQQTLPKKMIIIIERPHFNLTEFTFFFFSLNSLQNELPLNYPKYNLLKAFLSLDCSLILKYLQSLTSHQTPEAKKPIMSENWG